MNNNYLWLKIKTDYYKFIKKISKTGICINDLKKEKEYLIFKINEKDYNRLRKCFPIYHFTIYKKHGLSNLKDIIKKYRYYFFSFFIGLILLLFLSNIIVDIDIIHSSKKVRLLVKNALEDEGVERLTLKKDYKELNKIKEKILKKYPKDLEWLEIEVHGMKYVIRVEQRIINEEKDNPSSCHIIAKKSGIITDIITKKGETTFSRGDYISKGDIVINGNITFNNEIKNTVCAQGIVKAEVWYTVNVSMPLTSNTRIKTKKKRINIVYDKGSGKRLLFKEKFKYYDYKDKYIFNILDTKIYRRTEQQVIIKKKKYSKEEAITKATILALEKINIKKGDKDKVITQKVLKKELNNSTINLEMFFAVEEEIGIVKTFKVESEE